MADQWYFAKGERKLGPYSPAQFKELADSGQLLPTDTVWKEGIEKGVLAAKVKNLFTQLVPPSPAPPVPMEQGAAEELIPGSRAEEEKTEAKPPETDLPSAASASANLSPGPSPVEVETTPPSVPATQPEQPAEQAATPEQQPPAKKTPIQKPPAPQKTTRTFRVVGARGAIVLGQDGTYVKYKKKCPVCGTEDSSVRTLQIRSGINRDRYFCQKCKKLQHVEIHGAV
jgi:GYF domain 2